MIPFRERFSLAERIHEFSRAMHKREGYIPTVIERGSPDAPLLGKVKYMIPEHLNVAQLTYIVRKRLRMKPSEALFLLCNKTMLNGSDTLRSIYTRHRNTDDGFLYIHYTLENVFGGLSLNENSVRIPIRQTDHPFKEVACVML